VNLEKNIVLYYKLLKMVQQRSITIKVKLNEQYLVHKYNYNLEQEQIKKIQYKSLYDAVLVPFLGDDFLNTYSVKYSSDFKKKKEVSINKTENIDLLEQLLVSDGLISSFNVIITCDKKSDNVTEDDDKTKAATDDSKEAVNIDDTRYVKNNESNKGTIMKNNNPFARDIIIFINVIQDLLLKFQLKLNEENLIDASLVKPDKSNANEDNCKVMLRELTREVMVMIFIIQDLIGKVIHQMNEYKIVSPNLIYPQKMTKYEIKNQFNSPTQNGGGGYNMMNTDSIKSILIDFQPLVKLFGTPADYHKYKKKCIKIIQNLN
jgi:hypothetical protein